MIQNISLVGVTSRGWIRRMSIDNRWRPGRKRPGAVIIQKVPPRRDFNLISKGFLDYRREGVVSPLTMQEHLAEGRTGRRDIPASRLSGRNAN